MQKQEFLKLIDKYLAGHATAREEQLLHNHFESFQEDAEWDAELMGVKTQLADRMLRNIRQAITRKPEQSSLARVTRLRHLRNIAAAVSALAIVGTVLYDRPTRIRAPVAIDKHVEKNDVQPGGNKAILTLGNGTRVILDSAKDGLLVKKDNIDIAKTKNGQLIYVGDIDAQVRDDSSLTFNTISTPKGGQYQIVLSDGTKVWLNAASALTFPTAFKGHDRTVELSGEAYFEVAKNAAKPFLVKVDDMQVRVLGTNFNVMAYPEEPAVKTTLLEGSVRLTQGDKSNLLQAGQQAIVNNKRIEIVDVDTEEAIAWKNGYFDFNRSSIREIMNQLSRWYDTDVTYESIVPEDEFVGKIGRNSKLSQVLHILELSHVHFRIENKKIIVTP